MIELVAAVGAVLAALGAAVLYGTRKARGDRERKDLKDAAKRTEAGRKAVQRGRASGADPAERVRKNDRNW